MIRGELERALLHSDLKELKAIVDAELVELSSKIAWFGLSDQMSYAVLSYGKRLRPIMTLLSTASVGGEKKEAVDLALALELMHTATLVHDDVLDNDATRRGLSTVHKKWSVGEAILTGDALLSLALSLIVNYGREVLKVFSEAGMLLAEGEYLDLVSFRELSEEMYLKRIGRKSASLFRAATECGALIGKGSPLEVSTLSRFGENFGMAYQVRDDILDITDVETGEISPDLKQKRVTLPIIHLLSRMDEQEKEALYGDIEKLADETEPDRLACFNSVVQLLNEAGSLDYCIDKVNFYIQSALEEIQPIDDTVFKKHLTDMTRSLVIYPQAYAHQPPISRGIVRSEFQKRG